MFATTCPLLVSFMQPVGGTLFLNSPYLLFVASPSPATVMVHIISMYESLLSIILNLKIVVSNLPISLFSLCSMSITFYSNQSFAVDLDR